MTLISRLFTFAVLLLSLPAIWVASLVAQAYADAKAIWRMTK